MEARTPSQLIGWTGDSLSRTHPPKISATPPNTLKRQRPGASWRPVHWPQLLRGLERGQAFYLDPAALANARRAAARAHLHLRPVPIGGPGEPRGGWVLLRGYLSI